MDELRIPTRRLAAEVVLAGGTRLLGCVFLPEGSRHAGDMRPEEWANDGDRFFPFLPDGQGRPLLLAKDSVLAISLPEPVEEMAAPVMEKKVTIECAGLVVEGSLRLEMPSGRQRVLDYLNGGGRFVAVYSAGREHLVQKSWILKVVEAEEEA
jgi:hypothetical protein